MLISAGCSIPSQAGSGLISQELNFTHSIVVIQSMCINFITSGLVYKAMQLKDKLPSMSEKEQIELLASDGKLIKRPLLVSENKVLVGFKAAEWEESVK